MQCSSCGAENPAGKRFCRSCGASLDAACPSCGSPISADDRFCGECGTVLQKGAAAPPPQPPPEPATERRLVSVLFADLVGFTTVSEGRDSEEVRALLSRYFDTCRRLIEIYGGTVEKFIGDAVMAVWGAQAATENDAERAVRAALDLVAAVTALGDELGISDLQARAGVATGEATVTVGAQGEGMVAGDLVNTASRIQSLAAPGSVLVADPTRRATEPTVVFEDTGEHELKGKIGLYRLYRAVRVVSGARGSLKSEGLEAPFVGRERELRQIKDLFHACAEERRPHLISVTGIAGIGKSRLVWEFYKYFDGLAQVIYWHRGRCPSYGEGVTYWALADMVRMRCRIAEEEPAASAMQKLSGVLDEHVADPGERAFVEPRVAHLLGIEGAARFEREDLFSAWRLFFERLADVYPTVLAFEDMQWADASLLDFIEYLLEWSRTSPLYVITAARPELVEKRPTWGAGKRNFTSLYLEPLSEPAMRGLLAGLVPDLPEGLAAQILGRSQGVPLYAVETVRMLLDRGQLVQEGAVYRATGPVETLEVPETLHALIAARLDGLSVEERQVVQNGAVLGKTFTCQAVAALVGEDEARLTPILNGLVRKEVLSIQSDPRSPEHGQYGFLQDLMRRVAYDTLSLRERRARHLAAAEYLESAADDQDELVEMMASHYLDAFSSAPDADDAARIRDRARTLFVRAARRALSLGAMAEAYRYFIQAAELTEDELERAGLLDLAGQTATRAGTPAEAADVYEQAITIYDRAGDTHAAARVTARLGFALERAGQHSEAIERMETALAVIGDDEPDADVALATVRLGNALLFTGDVDRGGVMIERALDMGEALGIPDILVYGWAAKGVWMTRHRRRESVVLLAAAAQLAIDQGLLERAGVALGNLSDQSFNRDEYADSLVHLNRALEIARTSGDRPNEWFSHSESTYALYQLGRWDEALEAFAELPRDQLAIGLTLLSPITSVLEIHIHRGEMDEAREVLAMYQPLEASIDVQDRAGLLAGVTALASGEGRHADAVESGLATMEQRTLIGVNAQAVKQALVWTAESAYALGRMDVFAEVLDLVEQQPPGLRSPLMDSHALRLRARLADDADGADTRYRAAAASFDGLGIRFWGAVARLEHAESLLARGEDPAEARRLLDAARETFAELRAMPWIERADGVGAGVTEVVGRE
jgi:class 3 adenylate cyclase/tetratricopeptide (TPR) repeat protein